jgi:hypothetical protein
MLVEWKQTPEPLRISLRALAAETRHLAPIAELLSAAGYGDGLVNYSMEGGH